MLELPPFSLGIEALRRVVFHHQHFVQLVHAVVVEDDENEGPVHHEEQGGDAEDDVGEVEDGGGEVLHGAAPLDEVDVVGVRGVGVGVLSTTVVLS